MLIAQYCRQNTKLTAMQVNLLKRIDKVLPLVADLAHAHVAIYVVDKNDKDFTVVSTSEPHTTFNPFKDIFLGKRIPIIQEPIIKRTFDDAKQHRGRRECDFGKFLNMYTVPIRDEIQKNQVIAICCFEINEEDIQIKGFVRLLKAAMIILKNAYKNLDANMYRAISSRDGVIITDKNERIIFANMAASRIYHVLGIGNLIGYHTFDRQLSMHIVRETISHKCPYEKEFEAGDLVIVRRDIPITEGGSLLTRIIILSDITEVRKKDKELLVKSAVIQEIHHRVKNNLQTIASLLRLQARRSKSPEVKEALKDSVNRILSISVVHEFLSQQGDENIDVAKVTKNILDLVRQNMLDSHFKLTTKFSGNTIILPSKQASNIALIINELILNSIEHGFVGRQEGVIGLNIKKTDFDYIIELYDDGIGLPADFAPEKLKSLGLQIIRTMVEGDMEGKFELYNDHGTHAKIVVPCKILMEGD